MFFLSRKIIHANSQFLHISICVHKDALHPTPVYICKREREREKRERERERERERVWREKGLDEQLPVQMVGFSDFIQSNYDVLMKTKFNV